MINQSSGGVGSGGNHDARASSGGRPARRRSALMGRNTEGRAISQRSRRSVLAGKIHQHQADEQREKALTRQDEHQGSEQEQEPPERVAQDPQRDSPPGPRPFRNA
jgi:hypothetical protein